LPIIKINFTKEVQFYVLLYDYLDILYTMLCNFEVLHFKFLHFLWMYQNDTFAVFWILSPLQKYCRQDHAAALFAGLCENYKKRPCLHVSVSCKQSLFYLK